MLVSLSFRSGIYVQISSAVNERIGAMTFETVSIIICMTVCALLLSADFGGDMYSLSLRISR